MNISQIVNATPSEVDNLRVKLMDSIEYDFDERECSLLYRMAAFDLLTASECKASIMLMAQKLGDIPIVLCHECKQEHGVPGMYGFICNKCQNKETI